MESLTRILFVSLATIALLIFPCACANGPDAEQPAGSDKVKVEKTAPPVKPTAQTSKPAKSRKPADLSGVLAYVTAHDVKIELEAYKGKLKITSLIEPGTKVKKGGVLAKLDAPDLEDAAKDAKTGLTALELSHKTTKAEYDRTSAKEELALKRAKHALETTQASLTKWETEERADRIRSSEMELERVRHSIEDQKDELAQLDELYKGNELARESQDIVLKRARRRLKQTEESLKLRERTYQRMLKYDMPKADKDKKYAVESAEQSLRKIQDGQKENLTLENLKVKLDRSESSLKKARKKLVDLNKDAESLTLTAPCNGIAVVGAVAGNTGISPKLKQGDNVGPKTVVAGVFDPILFKVEVQVPAKIAASIAKGAKAEVTIDALELTLPGTVTACGLAAKKDKIPVVVEFRSEEKMLYPGLSAKVSFPKE
ncbi:MAG: HlyD family efflux transporter periplasmic adaptor subunit [Planctomycetota bacterium]|jgi:multidrug efflux pump subunit AcrA (membrane-fusion protein)